MGPLTRIGTLASDAGPGEMWQRVNGGMHLMQVLIKPFICFGACN